MTFWQRLYCHIWFRIHMVNAYSAYHRDDMITCVNVESKAYEFERRLITDEVSRRFV